MIFNNKLWLNNTREITLKAVGIYPNDIKEYICYKSVFIDEIYI